MNSVSINPMQTTNAAGSFSVQSDGYVQGVAMDDPAIRNALAGGVLASAEILPMWGGVVIAESIPAATSNGALGGSIARATTQAGSTGIAVFNQAHGWINTPQSPVPTGGAGQTVPFYRFGSGARIGLAIDPALVTLDGGLISQQVSWDFTNQKIIAYDAGVGAFPVKILHIQIGNSKTVSWDGVNSNATWNNAGAVALCEI
jgi:hypothetical protein